MGFTRETETLIQQIRTDKTYADKEIVLLADIDRHPFSDMENLYFVKGRPDTLQALERANTNHAWLIASDRPINIDWPTGQGNHI